MRATPILAVFLIAAPGALSGCSTYVNIPGQTGDVAINDPNFGDVVRVETVALKAAIADRPIDRKYLIRLPEGTSQPGYARVVDALGDKAYYQAAAADENTPVLEVRQVRIRGSRGEVDIIRPSDIADANSPRQLVTVHLAWSLFDNWRDKRIQVWQIPVDAALQQSQESQLK